MLSGMKGMHRYFYVLFLFLLMGFASFYGSWQATSPTLRDFKKRFQWVNTNVFLQPLNGNESHQNESSSEITSSLSHPLSSVILVANLSVSHQSIPSANRQHDQVTQLQPAPSVVNRSQPQSTLIMNLSQLLLENPSLYAKLANKSSLDFVAHFGVGHRLNRMSLAYYVSKRLGIGFRTFWGVCLNKEIFKHLFGPEPLKDLSNVTSEGQFLLYTNIVIPGPENLRRVGHNNSTSDCMCSTGPVQEKIQSDVKLYRTMRDRFRSRDRIEEFRQEHFDNASLVIGMHIRAGNGEKDHFVAAKRQIQNEDEWILHVARHIRELANVWRHRRYIKTKQVDPSYPEIPPVTLFLATDTPYMIQRFQVALQNDTIQVVVWSQERREDGGGVLFGAQNFHQKGEKCIPGWEATLADMILLSYADIVVAPRSSSFTQTLPMSLAYADRQERIDNQRSGGQAELPPAFCEMNNAGSEMQCYSTYNDWCCKGSIEFVGRDHIEIPDRNFSNFQYQLSPRPDTKGCFGRRFGTRWEVHCLPFDYSHKGW